MSEIEGMMKLDHQFICIACGAVFRPVRSEDICRKCEKFEQERLEAIAREMEAEHEPD